MSDETESTVGSSTSDERKMDEFDEKMIRAITEVKFKQRPKFQVFSDVNFQRECLEAHNSLRLHHGCAPLAWSQELADQAQEWCRKIAQKKRVLYPELPGIGENIELCTANDTTHLPTGQEVTATWAAQAQTFDFDKPRWRTDCQKFTQLIWKDTHDFGVSRWWDQNSNLVAIVALYRPSGNSNCPGEFALNVPRPLDGKPYLPPSSAVSLASLANCTQNTSSQ